MLQILLHRFIGDISGTPRSVTDGPKVPSPIFLAQGWVFLLQQPRGSAFHSLYQVRQRLRWSILNMHVHVVFAYHSLENSHVFGVAYLDQQLSTSQLDVPLQHRVAVLCHPYQVGCKSRYRVPAVSVFPHRATRLSCVATESLALKCIVSTSVLEQ